MHLSKKITEYTKVKKQLFYGLTSFLGANSEIKCCIKGLYLGWCSNNDPSMAIVQWVLFIRLIKTPHTVKQI